MNAKENLKNFGKRITPAYITKIAILSAISFVLYVFARFPIVAIFPSFLKLHFSELPAVLAGFSLGPVAGVAVIIIKCLLALPFGDANTYYVGELTDMLLGTLYVLPPSILYCRRKTKKTALIGLIIGTFLAVIGALFVNRFISVPVFVAVLCHGDMNILVTVCKTLYPKATADTFYLYYLSAAVLPFNFIRFGVDSILAFLLYKRLSKILHWEIPTKKTPAQAPDSVRTTSEDALSEIPSQEISSDSSMGKEQ